MKKIARRPIEVFCFDCDSKEKDFQLAIKQQYCRYLKGTCVKPRKSQPDVKVGICSLGATVAQCSEIKPVIVCPQRFKEENMFETIRNQYLSKWKNVKWIREVNIGVGGNIDYVAVEVDKHDKVKDFLCIELQAGGTTGTPYPAVQELIKYGEFKSKSYKYGINWANEFSKTMMQQAYKKGKIIESWNRKIVFVIQDVAMEYLYDVADCSKVENSNPTLSIDFCLFSMQWNNKSAWHLQFEKILSTSVDGINTILGGAAVSEYLTETEFIENIMRKGISDGILVKK